MTNFHDFDKINIGCGYDRRAGYLNVDMDPACNPDMLLTDNDFSNVPKRHFGHLAAIDVLEHVPRANTMHALLEWANILKAGGTMTLDTSSILGVAKLLQDRPSFADQHNLTTCLFGNQTHPGDFHYTGFTEATLRTYVMSAGFAVDSMELHDDWLFLMQAHKTLDWTDLLDMSLSDESFLLAAYERALFRRPEEPFTSSHYRDLAAGQPRRALLKQLFASAERNYRVAQRQGL
jgi:predicted SAM-dependent methyltransferase